MEDETKSLTGTNGNKKASAFYDIGVDLWDIMISDKTGLSMSDIGFNI